MVRVVGRDDRSGQSRRHLTGTVRGDPANPRRTVATVDRPDLDDVAVAIHVLREIAADPTAGEHARIDAAAALLEHGLPLKLRATL